jgi:chemotaxis protein MotB
MDVKKLSILFSLIVTGLVGFDSYFFLAHHRPLMRKASAMQQQVRTVQQELDRKVADLSKTVESKQLEIRNVQSTKDSLIAEMQQEIQNNQIKITQMADKLQLSIVDKILFPSGEAEISPEGLKVLERIGNILRNAKDKSVRVEGHTDNIRIGGRLKTVFPTNWELSTARATNVVRFLQEKTGMDPKRLEAVGLGPYRPLASNDTREGRAQNRRIEILLLPADLL